MMQSSPGGMALQDYHWSGGFYSPQFVSYDKWGQSLPSDLYGFNATDSEMIPSRIYQNHIQQFPIPVKNYELLETTPLTNIPEAFPIFSQKRPPLTEYFSNTSRYQGVIAIILLILMIYLFDKTFGKRIEESNIWVKIGIMIMLAIGLYFVTGF